MTESTKLEAGLATVSQSPVSALAPARLPVTIEKPLSDLTAIILHSHQQALAAVARGAWFAIQAGKALTEAKANLKKTGQNGLWQDYVVLECRMSLRTAQHYMYLAKNEGKFAQLISPNAQGSAFLSQAQALKFLGAERKKRKRRKATA